MKKVLIITAFVFTASFSFYLHESSSISKSITALSQSAAYESLLDLGMMTGGHKLDIGQADIK